MLYFSVACLPWIADILDFFFLYPYFISFFKKVNAVAMQVQRLDRYSKDRAFFPV